MTNQTEPKKQTSFLLARAKAAKAKAAAKQPSNGGNRTLTATSSLQSVPKVELSALEKHPTRQPVTTSSKPATTKPVASPHTGHKTDDFLAPAETSHPTDADAQIIELVRQNASNQQAVDLFEPDLPSVIRAIIRSAQIIGIRGHQDRMTLFRIMGMPWTPQRGYMSQQVKGESLDMMADRIARAVNRREGRLLGHEPVTVDVEPEPEPAESQPETV